MSQPVGLRLIFIAVALQLKDVQHVSQGRMLGSGAEQFAFIFLFPPARRLNSYEPFAGLEDWPTKCHFRRLDVFECQFVVALGEPDNGEGTISCVLQFLDSRMMIALRRA